MPKHINDTIGEKYKETKPKHKEIDRHNISKHKQLLDELDEI
jgi:hypothetical protein